MSTGADLSWDAYDLAHDAALRTGGDLVRAQAYLTYRWRRTPTPTEAIVRRMAMDVLNDAATESERACFRALLADPDAHFYVCGLKAMEEGVLLALRDVATRHGLDWEEAVAPALKREGRLHLETY